MAEVPTSLEAADLALPSIGLKGDNEGQTAALNLNEVCLLASRLLSNFIVFHKKLDRHKIEQKVAHFKTFSISISPYKHRYFLKVKFYWPAKIQPFVAQSHVVLL